MATGFKSDAFQTPGFQIDAGVGVDALTLVGFSTGAPTVGTLEVGLPVVSIGTGNGGRSAGKGHRKRLRKRHRKDEFDPLDEDQVEDALELARQRGTLRRLSDIAPGSDAVTIVDDLAPIVAKGSKTPKLKVVARTSGLAGPAFSRTVSQTDSFEKIIVSARLTAAQQAAEAQKLKVAQAAQDDEDDVELLLMLA